MYVTGKNFKAALIAVHVNGQEKMVFDILLKIVNAGTKTTWDNNHAIANSLMSAIGEVLTQDYIPMDDLT